MSDQVTHQLLVDPELHTAFRNAALREHRSAEQVLNELMRQYIHQVLQRPGPAHALPATEQERRAAAARFAKVSTELSGGRVTPKFDALMSDFVRNEMTIDQMVQAVLTPRPR